MRTGYEHMVTWISLELGVACREKILDHAAAQQGAILTRRYIFTKIKYSSFTNQHWWH